MVFRGALKLERFLRNRPEDTHTHTHTRPAEFKNVLKQTLKERDEALTAQMVARYIPTLRRGHGSAASLQKNIHRVICSSRVSFLLSDVQNTKEKMGHKTVPHVYQTLSLVECTRVLLQISRRGSPAV